MQVSNSIGTGTFYKKDVQYSGSWRIDSNYGFSVHRHGWAILQEGSAPQHEGLFEEDKKQGVFKVTAEDGSVSYKEYKDDQFVKDSKE